MDSHNERLANLLDMEDNMKSKIESEMKSKKSSISKEKPLDKAIREHKIEKELIENSISWYEKNSPNHFILEVLQDYLIAFNNGNTVEMRSIEDDTLDLYRKSLNKFYV